MNYTITLTQQQLLVLLQVLEQAPMPLMQSLPIYQSLRAQRDQQDKDNAIPVGGQA